MSCLKFCLILAFSMLLNDSSVYAGRRRASSRSKTSSHSSAKRGAIRLDTSNIDGEKSNNAVESNTSLQGTTVLNNDEDVERKSKIDNITNALNLTQSTLDNANKVLDAKNKQILQEKEEQNSVKLALKKEYQTERNEVHNSCLGMISITSSLEQSLGVSIGLGVVSSLSSGVSAVTGNSAFQKTVTKAQLNKAVEKGEVGIATGVIKSEEDANNFMEKSTKNILTTNKAMKVSGVVAGAAGAMTSVATTISIDKAKKQFDELISKVNVCRASVSKLSSVVEKMQNTDDEDGNLSSLITDGNVILQHCNSINVSKLTEIRKKLDVSQTVSGVGTAVGVAGQIAGAVGMIGATVSAKKGNANSAFQNQKVQNGLNIAQTVGTAGMSVSNIASSIINGTVQSNLKKIVGNIVSCESAVQ